MKKSTISLLLLIMATMTLDAQSVLMGDTNNDGQLTIADVTSTVNMVLGKSPAQTLNLNPYDVDNSMVVGTWYSPVGTPLTFGADGTTTYPGGASYEFMPSQGRLLIYDATGQPVKGVAVWKATPEYLLFMDYVTGAFTRYTNAVLVTGITLNHNSLPLNIGDTAQLTATVTPSTAFNQNVTWSSSNTDVATVDAAGLVSAVGTGSCSVTCAALDASGVSATCMVTVEAANETHEYVDLGLPSGTLWATCNIGANAPEDFGDYFAWGETVGGKTDFSWGTYILCNGSSNTLTKYCASDSPYMGYNGFIDNLTELLPEDDAAYVNWGADWRMPTKDQFDELLNTNYTTVEYTGQNGIAGLKITSIRTGYTDRSIFLPGGGCYNGSTLEHPNLFGEYWSRTLLYNNKANCSSNSTWAWYLHFEWDFIDVSYTLRYFGFSIRPVRAKSSNDL
ncbi:MAG: Ig-like domain-containing protein [Bacteroidaceae bacterium]|nr:Ig-like domain-containing protein [Bacteroidaceae bacterium]